MASTDNSESKKAWRKVMYERQTYPDNYIDREKFLDQLEVSQPKQDPFQQYWSLVTDTSVVAHQFSIVVAFLSVYKYVYVGRISKYQLFLLDVVCLMLPTFVTCVLDRDFLQLPSNVLELFRKLFIAGVVLRVSAPILQTLTYSFSEDTVHALTFILSAFHLTSFDYNFKGDDEYMGNLLATMSLNAAVFTSVLLASRMKEIDTVVAFIMFAAIVFAILPGVARLIRQRSSFYHALVTVLLWGMTSCLLYHLNVTLLVVYEVMITFLWLLCPFWYLSLGSSCKRALRGPWEEASVTPINN